MFRHLILSFCLFTCLSSIKAQEWKSWIGNYDQFESTIQQTQAVNSKGDITMVMQSDSVIQSGSMAAPKSVSERSLITITASGKIKRVDRLLGRSIEKLMFNRDDELFAITNQIRLKRTNPEGNYWLLKFDANYQVIDSIHLLTYYLPFGSVVSNVGLFDLIMYENEIAFAAKVNGKISIDSQEYNVEEAYFHGWVKNGPNSMKLSYKKLDTRKTSFATLDKPELAFLAGRSYVMLRSGNSTAKQLFKYMQGLAIDSFELPPNYQSVSITHIDINGFLYLHMNLNGKYVWKNTNISAGGLKFAILKIDENFDIIDFIVEDQIEIMTGSPGPTFNRYLTSANGHLYFSIGSEISKDFGWIKMDDNLQNIDTMRFSANLLNRSDPAYNPFYAYLLPYKAGVYQVFPNATWPDLALAQLNFPGSNNLDASILPVQNLIVHAGLVGASLSKTDLCDSTKFEILAGEDEIKKVKWIVDGKLDSLSFLNKTVSHNGFTKSKVCAEITLSNGKVELLCDSTNNLNDVQVGMKLDTQVVCQWNGVKFEDQSEFRRLFQSTYPKFVWEVWKNDTVFVSSTKGNPTLNFTTSGTYTVKHYFSNGYCTKGITRKAAIKVLPATQAIIKGLPYPVCKESTITLKAAEYNKVINQFTWSNGSLAKDSITQTVSATPYQWVILKTTSPNGCITSDSVYFRVRQTKETLIDSLVTNQNLNPVFYFDTASGFKKIVLSRSQPVDSKTFWMKKNHGDLEVDLNDGIPFYMLNGIDSCGNTLLDEKWIPILLSFNQTKNRLELDSQGFGTAQQLMRKKGESWTQLKIPLWELDLDTFNSGEYDFQYREVDTQTGRAIISNILELNFTKNFVLPNAFTPDGDEINDIFWAYTPKGFEILEVRVYSRTGQLVARSETLAHIWNGQILGKAAPVGKYTFVIRYVNGEEKYHNGTVMLLR